MSFQSTLFSRVDKWGPIVACTWLSGNFRCLIQARKHLFTRCRADILSSIQSDDIIRSVTSNLALVRA